MFNVRYLLVNKLLKRNLLSLFIYEKCDKIKLDTTLDSFIGEYFNQNPRKQPSLLHVLCAVLCKS